MRKISNILLIMSLLSAVVISCEQAVSDPDEISSLPVNDQILKEPINTLLECPDNLEINEFNLKLLDRSKNLIAALISRVDFKDQIISLYDQKPIMAFDSIYSHYKKISSIDRKVTYHDVEYEVGVRFYNYDKCDPSKNPIVCIGTEIPNSDPIYDDNIVGWIIGEDGINKEILISEEFADNTEHPLFIVVNGVYDKSDYNISSNQSEKKSISTNYQVEIYGEKITEEYEGRWSDSEYNVSWLVDYWEYDGIASTYYVYEHIADIKSREIGDDLTYDFQFYEYNPVNGNVYSWFGTSRRLILGVTYEHDWYASKKQVYIYDEEWQDYWTVDFRASGSDEYYQTFRIDIGMGGSESWSSYDEQISGTGYVKIRSVSL